MPEVKFEFYITGLTETWGKKCKTNLILQDIPNYHPYEFISGESQNSGCGLYVKSNLNYIQTGDRS